MPQIDGQTRTPPITLLRLSFVGLAVLALVLGYVGLADYLSGQTHTSGAPIDILYYDLQLFVLGAEPLSEGGPFPWPLQLARFAAPTATVFALVETARVLLTGELQRLRVRRAKAHAVVCGDSAVARVLTYRLRADGWRVVHILDGPAGEGVLHPRMYSVAGDPTNADVLRAAGVPHADVLYACADDNASNVLTATIASRLQDGRRSPVRVYAQIQDPELCLALQARRLSQPHPANVLLDFFNVEELAARTLLHGDALPPTRDTRILIAGTSTFGRAVLVESAQYWRAHALHSAGLLRVDLVVPDGDTAVQDLVHRYPFLPRSCAITVHHGDPATLLRTGDLRATAYHRAYLCLDDEELGLKTALTAQPLWRGGPGSVIVPVTRLSDLAGAFAGRHGTGLLDSMAGTIRLYSIVDAASDPGRIGDDLVERLARSIHDRYVLACRARGERPPQNTALVPWPDLPEELRRANRAQAQDIGRKLGLIGYALGPRVDMDDLVSIDDRQVEYLAAVEHDRWRSDLEAAGWRWGTCRDRTARTHPDLRAWEELPEPTREKNRQEMAEIPSILADVSLRVVGLPNGVGQQP